MSIPSAVRGEIFLLITPAASLDTLFEMVARLALAGRLTTVDGGNCFQGYYLARAIKRQRSDLGTETAFYSALNNILLSRVFTCYQMAARLEEPCFSDGPVMVLDFLATFYDQTVRVAERRRLLEGCLTRLRFISRDVPVILWVRQRAVVPQEGLDFLTTVRAAAGKVFAPAPAAVSPVYQPALFA